MSQKRKRAASLSSSVADSVFRSEPIEDRDSTFLGFFSPTLKPKDLQNIPEIKSASHKILAWRKESNQQSITGTTRYSSDSDDDGEKYAGKKVEKVLNTMQVAGACVVARWYGGTLLGPVRFEHIENSAREAVQRWQESVREEKAKKVKIEQDEKDRVRLVRVLGERDGSIEVLRKLAVEKEGEVKRIREGESVATAANGGAASSQAASSSGGSVKPMIDYAALPVDRLRAFEKARDATLGFLLKRIDKAEVELKELVEDDDNG